MTAHNPGSIVRVKLQRFMTYEDLEIYTSPGLNLIAGHNGSGKSTIMCGICLSLGGKATTAARFNQIGMYIQTGEESAFIEIELYDPPPKSNLIISREILCNNSSIFKINHRISTLKMVEKEISRFNIQCNNLCQFLPQEKVIEFSKMNPKELLENTEQAVGDQSIYDDHVHLKKLRAEHCQLSIVLKTENETLLNEVEKNKRMEADVQLHKQRELHVNRIKDLEEKLPWLKYQNMMNIFKDMRSKREKVFGEIKIASAKLEPMKKELREVKAKVDTHERILESLGTSVQEANRAISNTFQSLEDVKRKIADAKFFFQKKEKDESTLLIQIKHLKGIIGGWELELEEYQSMEEDDDKNIEHIGDQIKEIHISLSGIASKRDASVAKQRDLDYQLQAINNSLKKLQDDQNNKLNVLKIKEPHAYESVMWLRKNASAFKKRLHEPIMTVISVPDAQAAKYLENHIAYRDLSAFVAEDADDMNNFLSTLSDKKGLDISAVLGGDNSVSYDSGYPPNYLKSLGLDCWLKDLITAPPAVMNFLCKRYSIHKIPLAFENNKQKLNALLEKDDLPFNKFYYGDLSFRIRVSKYGDHVKSVASQRIRKAGLLHWGNDSTESEELLKRYQDIEKSISDEKSIDESYCKEERNYEGQMENLRGERSIYTKRKQYNKQIKTKIAMKKRSLQNMQSEMVDLDKERRNLSNKLSSETNNRIIILGKLCKEIKEMNNLENEKIDHIVQHSFALKMKQGVQKNLEESSTAFRTLQENYQNLKQEENKKKQLSLQLLAQARISSGLNPNDDYMPRDLMERLSSFPGVLEELEFEISQEQAKLDCISETDPVILRDYVEREKRIREMRSKILGDEAGLNELKERMTSIQERYLPKIEHLVKKISDNFGSHFSSIGCAGEVYLDKSENPEDFEKYGLSIMVKFRKSEQLRQLSNTFHSGGECSFSTTTYMLSLQEVSDVPFRCVDEINQGMDHENERDIFNLIRDSSCGLKCSQYFLITPKLLMDMRLEEASMQLCIPHNGKGMKDGLNMPLALENCPT